MECDRQHELITKEDLVTTYSGLLAELTSASSAQKVTASEPGPGQAPRPFAEIASLRRVRDAGRRRRPRRAAGLARAHRT